MLVLFIHYSGSTKYSTAICQHLCLLYSQTVMEEGKMVRRRLKSIVLFIAGFTTSEMLKTHWTRWTGVCWTDVSFVFRWRGMGGPRPRTAHHGADLAAAVHVLAHGLVAAPGPVLVLAVALAAVHVQRARALVGVQGNPSPAPAGLDAVAPVPSSSR